MKKYLMSSAGVVFAAMLAAPALAADGEVRIFTFEGYTDPDWVAARDASQVDGKILQPNGVTKIFLEPTDFSPVK